MSDKPAFGRYDEIPVDQAHGKEVGLPAAAVEEESLRQRRRIHRDASPAWYYSSFHV